jgi:hypothetical protein
MICSACTLGSIGSNGESLTPLVVGVTTRAHQAKESNTRSGINCLALRVSTVIFHQYGGARQPATTWSGRSLGSKYLVSRSRQWRRELLIRNPVWWCLEQDFLLGEHKAMEQLTCRTWLSWG